MLSYTEAGQGLCGRWERSMCQSHSMHFFLKKNKIYYASHIYWFLLESCNKFCLHCLYYCMSDCIALLTMHLCTFFCMGDKCICIYFCKKSFSGQFEHDHFSHLLAFAHDEVVFLGGLFVFETKKPLGTPRNQTP